MTQISSPVRLGLIGDNIAASLSPKLHELAGQLTGIEVSYERLIPRERDQSFEQVFEAAKAAGFRGLNITYPYKEKVVGLLNIPDPRVKALGACNTVLFKETGPEGHNTDWSGFMAAYARIRGDKAPGVVCMVGAGGVGKAVAFGLVALGLRELRLVERDLPKAEALAEALRSSQPDLLVSVTDDVQTATAGADGLINCTPVGMVGYEGTPIPAECLAGATWVFDAVYTPVDTQFLQDAAAAGLEVISGYELYFFQGFHAFAHFHGREIDEATLRQALTAL